MKVRLGKVEKINLIVLGIVAVMITVFGILLGEGIRGMWKSSPLYISLVISFLQSRVSRWAPLLGGLNSIFYAVVYFAMGLYGSAVYAITVSSTLQIIAFINWSKKTTGSKTTLRRLTKLQYVFAAVAAAVCYAAVYFISSRADGANYIALDSLLTTIGIIGTLLMMFRFVEYVPITIISCICSLALYFTMLKDNPQQLTYVIYTFYCLSCNLIALVRLVNEAKMHKKDMDIQ